MRYLSRRLKLFLSILLILCFSLLEHVFADDVVLMSYGGHSETIGPYWVAVEAINLSVVKIPEESGYLPRQEENFRLPADVLSVESLGKMCNQYHRFSSTIRFCDALFCLIGE